MDFNLEFDPASIVNQLGAGAVFWFFLYRQMRTMGTRLHGEVVAVRKKVNAVDKQINNGLASTVESLPCVKGDVRLCRHPSGDETPEAPSNVA